MSEEDDKSLGRGSEAECREGGERSNVAASELKRDLCFLLDMDGGGGLCFEAVAEADDENDEGGSGGG